MKRKYLILSCAIAASAISLFSSCGNKNTSDVAVSDSIAYADSDSMAPVAVSSKLKTEQIKYADSLKVEGEDGPGQMLITLDALLPKGNENLETAVKEDICKFLTILLDEQDKGTDIKAAYKKAKADAFENDIPSTYSFTSGIEFENETYVTFFYTFYGESEGAAHGGTTAYGQTYRKDNGERLTWNHFIKSNRLHAQIMDGLKKYFDVKTDAQLYENLFPTDDNKLSSVPFPEHDPCMINADSLDFAYQQYEIASYADGMPSTTIAIKDVANGSLKENGIKYFGK